MRGGSALCCVPGLCGLVMGRGVGCAGGAAAGVRVLVVWCCACMALGVMERVMSLVRLSGVLL